MISDAAAGLVGVWLEDTAPITKMYAELMQKIQNPVEWVAAVKPLQDKARDALAEINDVTAHLAELHKHYAELVLLDQIKQQ